MADKRNVAYWVMKGLPTDEVPSILGLPIPASLAKQPRKKKWKREAPNAKTKKAAQSRAKKRARHN